MSIVTAIAFAVFFACCIAQFPLGHIVRAKLDERHPKVLAELSRKSWFLDAAVLRFASSEECKELKDADLSRAADRIKWLNRVAISAWLVLAIGMFSQSSN